MLLPMYVPTCSGCNGKSSLLLTPLLVSCVIFGNALQSARDHSFPNVVSLVVDEGGVASIANDASSDAFSMSVAEGSARTKNSRRLRRRGLTGTLARKHTKGADKAAKIEQALEHIRELQKEAALAKEELEELLQENDGDGDDDDNEVDDDDDDDEPDVICGPGGDIDCEDIDGDETDEEGENDDDTEDACPVRYYVSQKQWQTYVQKGEAYTENGYSPTGWVLGDSGKSFLAWEMDTGTLKEFKTTGDSFYAYSAIEPGTTQWTIRNHGDRYLILESDNVEAEWHGWNYHDSFFTSSSPPPGCEEDEGGTSPAPPPVPAPPPTGPAPAPTGPAPSPTGPAPSNRTRGAMIWDAACPDGDGHYQRTNDLIFEKYYPSGVDMWAYMAYELRPDSTFNTQIEWAGTSRPGCGRKMEEKGIASLRDDPRNGGRVKQFPAIIICDQGCHGGIDHLRTLIRSEEKKTNFITAAVQRMKDLRFDGYDIDWEVAHGATNPPSQDSQDFTQFLQEFSAALKAEGGSLGTAMALGGASREYVGMSTEQLLHAGWDRLVSMASYGAWGNFDSFKSMVQMNWNRLGEKYAVGANVDARESNGHWLGDEARRRFRYLKDHFPGIKRIGVWHAYTLKRTEAESFLQHLRDWVEDR